MPVVHWFLTGCDMQAVGLACDGSSVLAAAQQRHIGGGGLYCQSSCGVLGAARQQGIRGGGPCQHSS